MLRMMLWHVALSLLCLVYIYPIVLIFINSLKQERAISTTRIFELPTAETFNGLGNYFYGITSMNFLQSFWYSLFISVSSYGLDAESVRS